MTKYVKKSFFVLFFIVALFIGAQLFLSSCFPKIRFNLIISSLYLWTPGVIALFFSYKEKIKLPVFKRPNRYWYLAVISATGIALLALFLTMPFGSIDTFNPTLARQSFFYYYFLFLIVSIVFFLGGELYWRGYLWEKLKSKQYKAVWMIAFVWSLWTIPLVIFPVTPSSNLPASLLEVIVLNFALTPILLYYRVKSKSILAPTLFGSFLLVTQIYFRMLFPSFFTTTEVFYSSIVIALLVIYSLFLKLYSKSLWKGLAK